MTPHSKNSKKAAKGVAPDPVGMRFETSRYPAGAWLKVDPDGFCSEAYSAKYYQLAPLEGAPEFEPKRRAAK